MTEEKFRKLIQHTDKMQDVMNYSICVLMILGGLYFISTTLQIIGSNSKDDNSIFVGLFLITFGLYGLWRIPKDYQIITINSNNSIEEKNK